MSDSMLYPVRSEKFGNQQVTIETSMWNQPKLLIDGSPAPQTHKKTQFLVINETGTESIVELNVTNLFDPVPKMTVDGSTVRITNSLAWYEYLAIGLPLLLVGIGGALGGGIGALAVGVNRDIMRSELPAPLRYLVAIGVTGLAFVLWLLIASALRSALQR